MKALVRSDVTRYLEFLPVNRLLYYNPEGNDDRASNIPTSSSSTKSPDSSACRYQSSSSLLVKVS